MTRLRRKKVHVPIRLSPLPDDLVPVPFTWGLGVGGDPLGAHSVSHIKLSCSRLVWAPNESITFPPSEIHAATPSSCPQSCCLSWTLPITDMAPCFLISILSSFCGSDAKHCVGSGCELGFSYSDVGSTRAAPAGCLSAHQSRDLWSQDLSNPVLSPPASIPPGSAQPFGRKQKALLRR